MKQTDHILIAIDSLRYGGAEIAAIRIANELCKECKVSLFVLNENLIFPTMLDSIDKRIELIFYLKDKKVSNFFSWKINGMVERLFNKQWRNRNKKNWIRQYLKENKIKLINSHSVFTDRFFAEARINTPLVITLHGYYEDLFARQPKYIEETLRMLEKKVKAFVYLTDRAESFFKKHGQFNHIPFTKVYTGFRLPANLVLSSPDPNYFTFGMIGRGVKEKGWNEAFAAFKIISQKYPQTRFIGIGGGEYAEKQAKLYSINSRQLELIASTPEPLQVISRLNAGLLPSYGQGESLPNFIVESMFLNIPVIAGDCGEIAKMINTGSENPAGILIPNSSGQKIDVALLAAEMERLITQKELYEKLKQNTLHAVKMFDPEQCRRQYISIFEAVLNRQ